MHCIVFLSISKWRVYLQKQITRVFYNLIMFLLCKLAVSFSYFSYDQNNPTVVWMRLIGMRNERKLLKIVKNGFIQSFRNSSYVASFCNSCVWVLQLSSVWKYGSHNHTVTFGKVKVCRRCWKNKECAEAGGFFWRTSGSWTALDQQGTHEQQPQNIKTVLDHPGNDTQH